jgi:CBS domain-containing protein
MTVGEICTRAVVTAQPDETVVVAARRMRDRHVGTLVVIADGERRPVGVITDRDLVVSAVAQSPDKLESLQVGDVMSRDLVTALTTESVDDALARMRSHGIRRLPVVARDGQLEGLVAFDDIIEHLSEDLTELAGLVASEQKHERDARR